MKFLFPLALATAAALPNASQSATELVLNGGFEYEMGGWSCNPSGGCQIDNTVSAHSGVLGMLLQNNDGASVLSQSFETVVGAVYNLSFWVKLTEQPSSENAVWWSAGDVVASEIAGISGNFAQIIAQFTATSDTTTLAFYAHTANGALALDDISVTEGALPPSPVPLPASAMLLGMGLTGLAALRRRARS
jgi:hypothetical protein